MLQRFLELLLIIDPLGAVPVFLSAMAGKDDATRAKNALLTATALFIGGTFFALIGMPLLNAFAISMSAFSIVGGIVLFLVGFHLMQLTPSKLKTEAEMPNHFLWLLPTTFPLLLGPASIGNLMVNMNKIASIVALLGVAIVTYGTLHLAAKFFELVEPDTARLTMSIAERLVGMIVCAIGVDMIIMSVTAIGLNFHKMIA